MKKLAQGIVRHRAVILIVFAVLAAASALLAPHVRVNYQLAGYLPPGAMSARGLKADSDAFGSGGKVRVLADELSVFEALDLKRRMAAVEGVAGILWLDDVMDISIPRELWDPSIVRQHYIEGAALFEITLAVDGHDPQAEEIIRELRAICGEGAAFSGSAVAAQELRETTPEEIGRIILFLVPILLIVLLIATHSWVEPLLLLAAMGTAILINMGTNILLPGVSYITQRMIFALQMAVSIDYAIFLFHRFSEARTEGRPAAEAMQFALERAIPSLVSCAATMIAGFLALCFMQSGLGADMGIVFAKGVVLSFLTVLLLLPALILVCEPLIHKTQHRPFLPSFLTMGRFILKLRWLLPVVAVLAIPAVFAVYNMPFIYAESAVAEGQDTRIGRDTARIESAFGRYNPVVVLIPPGNLHAEIALTRELTALPYVRAVQGLAALSPPDVPRAFLPETLRARFESPDTARLIVLLDTPAEGSDAFAALDAVYGVVSRHYGGDVTMAGSTVAAADMRDAARRDTRVLTAIAVAAVWLILLLAFRSLTLPFLLVAAIQFAVWIGMSAPYFAGTPASYLGYIVVSCVQLGATIDYAILFTHQYEEQRRRILPDLAIPRAIAASARPILTSAAILSLTGFTLRFLSSTATITQIGALIGRGALLSAFMVLFVLPQMLAVCDKAIRKTTLRRNT
jgi:hypothetical protein